jgi:2-oxoglutarate dehydrogenase E2 component (dihydrolipoamide succinyltransferase)
MTDTPLTFALPSLGEDVDEATISRWLVAPGDHIAVDAPLLEVSTDKVDTELPAPCDGLVVDILVGEGDVVVVGQALATLAVSSDGTAATTVNVAAPTSVKVPPAVDSPEPPTPRAHHVEGAAVGTTVAKLPRIRQTLAKRMMQSLHGSAQLTTVVEVDVTGIASLRAELKDRFTRDTGSKLTFLPFFAKATVDALTAHPVLAATVNPECTELTYHDDINLGIAVDGPKGLMVPVIPDAAHKTVGELAIAIADLAERVRNGTIGPDELTGGTFTITNTGSRGALFDTPILNQPQSGILGTGAVVERVVPWRDPLGGIGFAVRSMVYLAATYDHRVVDGADAARFLSAVKARLESSFTDGDVFDGAELH